MSDLPGTPRFQRSAATTLLYERVARLAIGEEWTYAEAAVLASMPDGARLRAHLRTARAIALHDDGIVTGALAGVGIRRLADQEIVALGSETLAGFRRGAARTVTKLRSVDDLAGLSVEDRAAWESSMALLGVIDHLAIATCAKRVTADVDGARTLVLATNAFLRAVGKDPNVSALG